MGVYRPAEHNHAQFGNLDILHSQMQFDTIYAGRSTGFSYSNLWSPFCAQYISCIYSKSITKAKCFQSSHFCSTKSSLKGDPRCQGSVWLLVCSLTFFFVQHLAFLISFFPLLFHRFGSDLSKFVDRLIVGGNQGNVTKWPLTEPITCFVLNLESIFNMVHCYLGYRVVTICGLGP